MKNKNFSLKAKLLLTTLPITLLMIIILVVISYFFSARIIRQESQSLLETSISKQQDGIENWIAQNLDIFGSAKKAIEATNPNDAQLQQLINGYYNFNSNSPNGIYVADSQGHYLQAAKSDQKIPQNPAKETWYKQALTHVNLKFGASYTNNSGKRVISATGIIANKGSNLQVIGADFNLDRVSTIVNSNISMEGAKAFLVNSKDYTVMADRNSNYVGQKLTAAKMPSVYRKVSKMIKRSDFATKTKGQNFIAITKISGTDWILVSYIPTSVILANLYKLRLIMIGVSIITLLVVALAIARITSRSLKPVTQMTQVITQMSNGDFTVDIHTKGSDEIAAMAQSVSQFIQNMRQMLLKITNISGSLEKQAVNSENVANKLHQASETQTTSMNELNTTVDQLSLSVTDIAENASQLAEVVTDTKDNSDQARAKMDETVDVTEQGRQDMQQVAVALNNIQTAVTTLQASINKVGQASGEIVNIVQIIGEIAHQTNLLSLNASLEAARAGDAGKGFAVVASEINNLAKSSAASVAQIDDLIKEVNTLVADTVNQADTSVKNITDSAGLINTAINSFNQIYTNIQETSSMISQVVAKIDGVDQVATNVAAISQEQAASSDEISATSETTLSQAASIAENSSQVATEAKHLADTSEDLAHEVNRFKI